ncbi:MAG: SpaA isopeptide-forming pilin-related protein [Acutalibacteraceae bacterium]
MKAKTKRVVTAMLAVVMLITTLLPLTASAADVTMDLNNCHVSWDYTLTDEDGDTFSAAYGLRAADDIYFNKGFSPYLSKMHDYTAKRSGLTGNKSDWVYGKDYVYCFCIERGIPLPDNTEYAGSADASHGDKYKRLLENQKDLLKLALTYGYPNRVGLQTSKDANACYAATQLIVWQITMGFRSSATELNDKTYPMSGYSGTMTEQYTRNKYLKAYYDAILSDMARHYTRPSFTAYTPGAAQTYEMEYKNGKYTVTLTDSNNMLGDYYVSVSGGVSASASGNTLTLSSTKPINDAVTVKLNRRVYSTNMSTGFLIWSVPGKESTNQDMVSGVPADNDPVPSYLKVRTAAGSAKIVKVSEDGKVDGITFRIQGNGIDKTVKTANGGVIQVDNLKPGVYTVTETEYDKYIPQEVRRVTVVSGQVSTVNFSNKLRRGDLTVKKTAEDGLVDGMKFRLYGTSLSGIEVNEYAVTDKNGVAKFKDVLIGTGYTLEEVDTPTRYVVPEKQTAAIEWNKVTNKSFDNVLKKFNVTVTKSDSEKGLPQGDASLAGAVYGIYKGNQLIDTYTTDANGQFTTKYYICGNDWSLKEISPSEGYLLNTESQHIGAEAKLYTVEYNIAKPLDSLENVIKGKIAVIKHCDDGSTKIETPEKGAEFEVYLKAAGSYENAEETERDILVCDENGFAETKELPYGEYTVKQTKGWEGKELLAPFNVFVKENGETYRFLINNATFEALIEIVKKDAETGKIIPASGIGFKVRNTDTGEYIVQHINYPTPMDIDTYYTDVTGKLMMPEKLPYGNYEIIEQCTAYGYVLDSAPIAFKVDGSKTVVSVEKHNMPQKGIVNISKSGEVFFSAVESDGVYSFIFADKGLAGATYEITAAEDIITPDGTLRYAKGTIVDTVTTDENGNAASKPLYLGKYTVRETKAPYGMVLNDEAKSVELTYAGETVKLTETSAEFYNERQKAEVSLSKILGKDETFGIGNNGEILSVQFGLYAAEDLTAADGSVIPKDGLLEVANCNENGNITFKTDIPVGAKLYVKEIATDSHYILSDEKYPVTFDYAGQDTALVEIKANGGEAIKNDILYGSVKGLKIDRETEAVIAGAKFGLFRSGETEFTAENALLTTESGEDGVFTFENIPYGDWLIKELQPADGYLANDEIYPVRISENGQTVGITVVNDRIPEIETKATVNGEKTATAEGDITIEDIVSYKHLIPGKAYTVKGILMDKSTGKAFLIDGKELTSEVTFTSEESCGEVTVRFTFDGSKITKQTDLVVFETLYHDGAELAAHADIEDGGQTVTIIPPKPDIPQTGDNSNLGFWIGLGSVALGGVIACIIMYCKRKKDEDDE